MKKIKVFAALCCAAVLFAACETNEPNANQSNNHDPKSGTKEAVDLGLSVNWATFNVGATNPEEYGNYYAWGETDRRDNYGWDYYKYGFSREELVKYCGISDYAKDKTPDTLTTLQAMDDAATANWGNEWRMPTQDEWQELLTNCTRTWEPNGSIKGYTLKSKSTATPFSSQRRAIVVPIRATTRATATTGRVRSAKKHPTAPTPSISMPIL